MFACSQVARRVARLPELAPFFASLFPDPAQTTGPQTTPAQSLTSHGSGSGSEKALLDADRGGGAAEELSTRDDDALFASLRRGVGEVGGARGDATFAG